MAVGKITIFFVIVVLPFLISLTLLDPSELENKKASGRRGGGKNVKIEFTEASSADDIIILSDSKAIKDPQPTTAMSTTEVKAIETNIAPPEKATEQESQLIPCTDGVCATESSSTTQPQSAASSVATALTPPPKPSDGNVKAANTESKRNRLPLTGHLIAFTKAFMTALIGLILLLAVVCFIKQQITRLAAWLGRHLVYEQVQRRLRRNGNIFFEVEIKKLTWRW